MDMSMTIEDFRALLTSKPEKGESPLLAALRCLTAIEKPEDVNRLSGGDEPAAWTDWHAV